MAIEKNKRVIRGVTFEIEPLPASISQAILVRVLGSFSSKAFGVLRGVGSKPIKELLDEFLQAIDLTDVVEKLLASGESGRHILTEITDQLAGSCRVLIDGEWQPLSKIYEEYFARAHILWFSWLSETIRCSYPDFFPESLESSDTSDLPANDSE